VFETGKEVMVDEVLVESEVKVVAELLVVFEIGRKVVVDEIFVAREVEVVAREVEVVALELFIMFAIGAKERDDEALRRGAV
jgi:hypothetical protein